MIMIHVNDTIRFLNTTGGGKVVRLDDARQMAYVETEDGFVIPTRYQECVVVSSDASAQDYSVQIRKLAMRQPSQQQMSAKAKADMPKPDNSANGKKTARQDDTMEVDLHISALLPGRTDIAPAEMLDYQLKMFRKVMQAEIRHRGKRIVFIHGDGRGVLKRQLQSILRRDFPSCLSMEARMQKYGTGATMVIIN